MAAVVSGGKIALSDTNYWSGPIRYDVSNLDLSNLNASYSYIYRKQLWVYVVVNKLARGTARLPLKVYEKTDKGREERPDSPYAKLLNAPNPKMDPFFFWLWTTATENIYGEALWLKIFDRRDRPAELWPLHPANVTVETEGGEVRYFLNNRPDTKYSDEEIVHFRTYNPESTARGLSPCEPLRQTLLNEDASRRATAMFWQNGGRPSMVLKHPAKLSDNAAKRLAADFSAKHGGVENFAKPAVLEEGMEAQVLSLSAEEAQYIESRKLNREEVCGAWDVPPPVVHILDRATFSNITEQMRSMYRDTMAPRLNGQESVLRKSLRPHFGGEEMYEEFLMEGVLRGAFETRTDAYRKAITSGWMTPAEVREAENLPFIEGSDNLIVNSASISLEEAVSLNAEQVRTVMGRLSRLGSLEDLDPARLTAGLNGASKPVLDELEKAKALGESVGAFGARIRSLGGDG